MKCKNAVLWLLLSLPILSVFVASAPISFPHPETKILYEVPLVRQSTTYSCGASALQSVLAYYGLEFTETEVMEAVGTDPKKGTLMEKLAAYANLEGILARVNVGTELQEIAASLRESHPVIVEVQAWPDEETPKDPYANTWDEGHYVVVIGLDKGRVYFMDPSLIGGRGYLPISHFLTRWHDIDEQGAHRYQTAIFFRGVPHPPAPWTSIP